MQPRRVSRELAFLGLSQLPANPDKLQDKQLEDLLLAAVRTLSEEARDVLATAAEEIQRSDRLLQESTQGLPPSRSALVASNSRQPEPFTPKASPSQLNLSEDDSGTEITRIHRLQDQLRRTAIALRTAEPGQTFQTEITGLTQQVQSSVANATQQLIQLEQRLQTVRQTVQEAISLSQSAINRAGYALSMPEFLQMVHSKEVRTYALQLLSTAKLHRVDIDKTLQEALVGWQLNRLGRVERDILRIAMTELYVLKSVPDRVAVNEAVELGKKYGTEESPGFINGVLRRIVKAKVTETMTGVIPETESNGLDESDG